MERARLYTFMLSALCFNLVIVSCNLQSNVELESRSSGMDFGYCNGFAGKFLNQNERLLSVQVVKLKLLKKGFCRAKIATKSGVISRCFDERGLLVKERDLLSLESSLFLKSRGVSSRVSLKFKERKKLRLCLWFSKQKHSVGNSLTVEERSSPTAIKKRRRKRKSVVRKELKKLSVYQRNLCGKLSALGYKVECLKGPNPYMIGTLSQVQLNSILSNFDDFSEITLCSKGKRGESLLSNQSMYSVKMQSMWNNYTPSLPPQETGKNAKVCILEGATVDFAHQHLRFKRGVNPSPSNHNIVPEHTSGTLADAVANAKPCEPFECISHSDCLPYASIGKSVCLGFRCASGTSCTSNSACLYGEACNVSSGRCEESCPNSMQSFANAASGFPSSEISHATKVAGIINAYKSSHPIRHGVSPYAMIYSANTGALAQDYSLGIEWCARKDVDIVNVSYVYLSILGSGDYATNSFFKYADWAANRYGILFVGGSGNKNSTGYSYTPYAENVFANGLTVGAYDHDGTQAWNDDFILRNSWGGTQWNNPSTPVGDFMKPDVYAPGTSIYTTTRSASGGGDLWDTDSGTSLAAPFVSALAAQIISWNSTRFVYGMLDYYKKQPILLSALIKNSSCNRLVADSGSPLSDYKIGQGGVSATLVYKTLEKTPAYFPFFLPLPSSFYPLYSYQVQLDPTNDFKSNSFYRWSEGNRPSISCFEVPHARTLRFTFAWETYVHGSGSPSNYDTHLDLDAYLYYSNDLDSSNNPTNYPIASSVKSDDKSETIHWQNQTGQTKTVCVQLSRYSSGTGVSISRLAWAGVVIFDECDSSTQ